LRGGSTLSVRKCEKGGGRSKIQKSVQLYFNSPLSYEIIFKARLRNVGTGSRIQTSTVESVKPEFCM